jgi:hypothetical protein
VLESVEVVMSSSVFRVEGDIKEPLRFKSDMGICESTTEEFRLLNSATKVLHIQTYCRSILSCPSCQISLIRVS